MVGGLRQIISIKKIDACTVLEHVDKFPMFKKEIHLFERHVSWNGQEVSLPCESHTIQQQLSNFFVKSIDCKDACIHGSKDQRKNYQPVPNGKYKTTFLVSDDVDDNIFTITYYHENNFFMETSEF